MHVARPAYEPSFWFLIIAGVGLFLFGAYGLLSGQGSSPRYAAGLMAFGLAGIVRGLTSQRNERVPSSALALASCTLQGMGAGLILAGLLGVTRGPAGPLI